MDFAEFRSQPAHFVSNLITEIGRASLGVGIPFNGTRRWYLSEFNKTPDELYTPDYPIQIFRRVRQIAGMMFADGIQTVYTPIFGRDLRDRGEEYMQFAAAGISVTGSEESIAWCLENRVHAAAYGQVELLPQAIRDLLTDVSAQTNTPDAQHQLRYGVFADQATPDLIARSIHLHQQSGSIPTETDLIRDYYGAAVAPVDIWIGCDQPTIFDVPLMIHGNTALYFLQFPTPYLNQDDWRRLLYDLLFVRGDQETLYADNLSDSRRIMGLGQRSEKGWSPSEGQKF